MVSPQELRAEVRRLHSEIKTTTDPTLKRELASRALELAMRAEIIANLPDDPAAIQATTARYEIMLAATQDRNGRRVLQNLLLDIAYTAHSGLRVAS